MRNKFHRKLRKEWCTATGKFKYLTREEGAAGMFLLASSKGQVNLSVYKCAHCTEFHVGHTPAATLARFGLGGSQVQPGEQEPRQDGCD